MTVYLTTPAVVPVLVNVCSIEEPQLERQLPNPFIVPPVGGVWIAAVQVNVVPVTLLDKAMEDEDPEQIVCEDGVAIAAGTGLTVISTVIVEPLHPLALGVTVYLTTPAAVPVLVNVCDMELPQAEGQLLKPFIVPPVGGV